MTEPTANARQDDLPDWADEVLHGALRGTIAAAAMSGVRNVTKGFGLVDQTPPEAIARQSARGLLRKTPWHRRRGVIELMHWGVGAGGGLAFGMLPDEIRRKAWSGPVYGLGVLLVYQLAVAPALGLSHARRPRLNEQLAFVIDHLVYGFTLSEFRKRPQD
jgi:hypothetical protein